MLNNRQGTKF